MIAKHSSEAEFADAKAQEAFMRVTTRLKGYRLVYLASPYTLYPKGLDAAAADVSRIAARLIEDGVNVYAPISHTHLIAKHGGIDPVDHEFWLAQCRAFMEACDAIAVAQMPFWRESIGISLEIEYFCENGKPLHMLPVGWLSCAAPSNSEAVGLEKGEGV